MKARHLVVLVLVIIAVATGQDALAAEISKAAPEKVISPDYADISAPHWAFEAVHFISSNGIMEGHPDGLFYGDQPLTRSEFPVALARIFATGYHSRPVPKFRWKSPDEWEKDRLFPPVRSVDVRRGHWAYEAVQLVQRLGIMQGNPQGQFLGDKPMTRYECAVAMQRLTKLLATMRVPE